MTGRSRRTERDSALARHWLAISRQSACTSRSTIAAARMRTGLYVSYAHERLVGGRLVEPGEIITIDFSGGPQRGDAGPKDFGSSSTNGMPTSLAGGTARIPA